MNMEIFGPFILSLVAGLSTMIGVLPIFIKIKNIDKFIVLFLSFSMSVLLYISLFDLLLNSIPYIFGYFKNTVAFLISFIIFILGYFTIYIINVKKDNSLYRVGVISMLSLMFHNLPEGMIVFMSNYVNTNFGIKLLLAIIFHNMVEGITIAIPIYYSTNSKIKSIIYTLIASLAEPFGALISYLFLKNIVNNIIISFILIFVSGLMISLSINEIYKEIKNYNLSNYSSFGYIIGIILLIIINTTF